MTEMPAESSSQPNNTEKAPLPPGVDLRMHASSAVSGGTLGLVGGMATGTIAGLFGLLDIGGGAVIALLVGTIGTWVVAADTPKPGTGVLTSAFAGTVGVGLVLGAGVWLQENDDFVDAFFKMEKPASESVEVKGDCGEKALQSEIKKLESHGFVVRCTP